MGYAACERRVSVVLCACMLHAACRMCMLALRVRMLLICSCTGICFYGQDALEGEYLAPCTYALYLIPRALYLILYTLYGQDALEGEYLAPLHQKRQVQSTKYNV